jgi:hypothetical protein
MLINPAAAVSPSIDRAVSFSIAPAPFGIGELSSVGALALLETPLGALGVSGERFGSGLYREITGTVTLARSFSGVDLGLGLSLQNISIAGYGGASAFGVCAGIRGKLTRELAVAASARNLNAPRIGSSNEELPQDYRAAVSYDPAASLTLTADYAKQTGFEPSANVGVEYRFIEEFCVRFGFSQLPELSSAGVGIRAGMFRVDYALTYHTDLGVSHVATLSLLWSR